MEKGGIRWGHESVMALSQSLNLSVMFWQEKVKFWLNLAKDFLDIEGYGLWKSEVKLLC